MTIPVPVALVPRHPVASPESLRSTKANVPSVADGGRFLLTRSGRSAIAIALRAAGLAAGDRVLVPDYYCPTMIAPVEAVGAKPVFYPLTARGTPDLEWLDHSVHGRGGALLAAHFFGLPITMQPLRGFCDQRGLVLIEDCAHAYFGSHEGVAVGATGDYAIASLPKFHAVPEGGLLVYREGSKLAEFPAGNARASAVATAWHILEHSAEHRRLPVFGGPVRWLSRQRSGARPQIEETDGVRPAPAAVREESLRDPLLAAAPLTCVERWVWAHCNAERLVVNRRRNYHRLAQHLAPISGGTVLFPEIAEGAVPYVLPFHVPDAERVYPRLRAARLPVFRWDRFWPGSPSADGAGALDWGYRVIQVSCHQDLTDADVDVMAERIAQALR